MLYKRAIESVFAFLVDVCKPRPADYLVVLKDELARLKSMLSYDGHDSRPKGRF